MGLGSSGSSNVGNGIGRTAEKFGGGQMKKIRGDQMTAGHTIYAHAMPSPQNLPELIGANPVNAGGCKNFRHAE